MIASITRLDGTRSASGLRFREIPTESEAIRNIFEIYHPSNNAQSPIRFMGSRYLEDDPDTDVGFIDFRYGDSTRISLSFDLEDTDECMTFICLRDYKVVSTIYLGRQDVPYIASLIVLPNTNLAIRR